MTYEFEGKTWELTFAHRTKLIHNRLMEPREGCEIYIREAGKEAPKKIRWGAASLCNPVDNYSKEMGRRKAINNLYRDTDMKWDEYVLVRKAYFLRKRDSMKKKNQRRALVLGMTTIIGDADTPLAIRQAASDLLLAILYREKKKNAANKEQPV